MTYSEVTEFLFSQLPMYQRQGVSAFKKNLDNIIALCKLLGNPQDKIRSIHIAGTNGKGSVSHMIAAGLQANGYKVGVYTSPHYKDYRERIKINGILIPEADVISFVKELKEDFEKIKPSFFEITVALAFAYFAMEKVDVAIIETGLGGRLDSTNIINPELSIITNISLDHTAMLGNTLELIAGEKAGIIKENVPVIIGEYQDEVNQVFSQKAEKMNTELYQADLNSKLVGDTDLFTFERTDKNWKISFKSDKSNPYQVKNLVTSLYALSILKDKFDLEDSKIASGLENMNQLTYYIGRWMTIQNNPKVIFDSAHNEAGVKLLSDEINKLSYNKLHIVWGAASDKDVESIFKLLPSEATYYFAKADIPRGMNADSLKARAKAIGLKGYDYPSVSSAYRTALTSANREDLVIVAGSIFVVAEVL